MTQNVNPLLAVLSYQPCLLRISNPQGVNRLGHFFTPDFKSVGTPGGVEFFKSVGTPAASGLVLEAVDRGRDSAYTVHEI